MTVEVEHIIVIAVARVMCMDVFIISYTPSIGSFLDRFESQKRGVCSMYEACDSNLINPTNTTKAHEDPSSWFQKPTFIYGQVQSPSFPPSSPSLQCAPYPHFRSPLEDFGVALELPLLNDCTISAHITQGLGRHTENSPSPAQVNRVPITNASFFFGSEKFCCHSYLDTSKENQTPSLIGDMNEVLVDVNGSCFQLRLILSESRK